MAARIDFLVFLLIVAGCASAAMNIYQMRHRTIVINFPAAHPVSTIQLPTTTVRGAENDEYATHAFPPGRQVCTYANTICWIKI